MKKLILLLTFACGVASAQFLQLDSKWRDSVGVLVPKKAMMIPANYILNGIVLSTGDADSLGGKPAEYYDIHTQASLYRPAYWAGTDSLGSLSNMAQAQGGDGITIGDSLIIGNHLELNGRLDADSVYNTPIASNKPNLYIGSDGIVKRSTDTSGSALDTTSLDNRINLKADLASPTFTGTPQITTDTIATKAYARSVTGASTGIPYSDTTSLVAMQWELDLKPFISQVTNTLVTNNSLVMFRGDSAVASVITQASGGDAINVASDSLKFNGSIVAIKSDSAIISAGTGIGVTYVNHTATIANTSPIVISIPLDSSYINVTDTVIVGSFPYTLTIDSIKAVGHGAASSFTYLVGHNNSIASFTKVVNAGSASTSITIGDVVTSSFDDATSVANAYYAVWFSSVTTKPKKAVITIFAHR